MFSLITNDGLQDMAITNQNRGLTGSIFRIITNDGRQDLMFGAPGILHARLAHIQRQRILENQYQKIINLYGPREDYPLDGFERVDAELLYDQIRVFVRRGLPIPDLLYALLKREIT